MAASQVLQCWKDFNLRQLQQELDKTATELAAKEDESEAAKKRLVEQSRDFRRSTAEELRKVSAPLLKSLQTEIDQLLRRFKYAETAFLNVYKKVIDLPDPVEVLEHVQQLQRRAQRSSELELENNQLRDTLNEYNNEFAQVKNQEVTIKSLKEKVRSLEEEMESKVCNQLKERERQLERSFAEKEREIQDSNLDVARRLGEAERTIETLRSALSQAQSELFDVKSKYDERANAKSDEIEMLLAEVDRATEKAAAGEKEVEQLKAQLETLTQNLSQAEQKNTAPNVDQAMNALKNSSLEVELASKDREYQQLIEEYQRLQRTHTRSKEEDNSRINRLEEELESAKEKIDQLEKRLSEQADYEELRRELAVIKSIQLGAASERAKPLEVLVLEKNKQLQSDLTQQKNANAELADPSSSTAQIKAERPPSNSSTASSSSAAFLMNPGVKKESSTSQHQTPLAAVAPQAVVSQLNGFFPPPVSSLAPAALVPPAHHPAAALFFSPHLPPLLPPTHFGSIAPALLHDHLLRPPTPPTSVPSTAPPPSQSPPNDALDTADVAQKIREILSTHNIGQRLFAKHVLGLSQGTVSELLSKPKHWDKLTEKGRESYRKMHAWAASEKNVVELKAISPKKGSSPMMSNYRSEDAATEERIQKILSEAHHAMQAKHSQEKEQWNRSIVSSIYEQELAKLGENGKIVNGISSLSSQQQYDAGEFTEQLVQRIYQEQLEKMIAHARKSGNVAQLNMYQAELLKVAQQVHAKGNNPHEDNKENLTDTKDEPTDLSIKKKEETLADSSPAERQSAFSIVRPESCQSNDSSSHNAMSPLQRMQNIANSLMNKGPNQGGTGGRPLKAVLPPITQEQFDKYSHIGTDELVKCVKETLSQFSISQRLFGENILGLSQGSVSDLLARPKPWHMLTQKGREPFIRMQMFLEDTESISKLVASQYRVPPEKLLRGSMGDEPPPPPPPPPPPQNTSSPAESDYRQSSSSVADSELDTLAITSKVKEVLTANNLGQKLFGEAILGLSQGSVSELLSKPKPWSMLSHKGREPFIKMHMWLQDPAKFDRLRLYQSETPAGKNSRKRKHQSAIISSNSNCCDNSASSSDNQKRPRVFFTEQQKETLRNAYASDPYPSQNVIENLANQLNVGPKTIVNWFHNHRMRAKQQQHSVSSPASSVSSSARTAAVDSDDAPSPASTASSSAGALTRPLNDAAQWLFPDFMPVKAEKAEEEEEIDEESSNMNVTVTKSNKRKAAKPKRVYERAEPERNGESWDDEDDVGSTSGLTVVAAC